MSKPLVIVESPAKARTISGFLGSDFVVDSSVGHIRDLPRTAADIPEKYKKTEAGRLGIDIENDFEPIYIVPNEKKKVVSELKKKLKEASELYLATDEDREGEAIAWHVLQVLKPKIPVKRMVFHEITREAIDEAISHARELDTKLVQAQEGRRVLDRLVGYETSPILWRKVMPKLSAGRVQSVATRLIVDRERERIAFVSASYFDVVAQLEASDKTKFESTLTHLGEIRIASSKDFDEKTGKVKNKNVVVSKDAAQKLSDSIANKSFKVLSVEESDWKQTPYPPFITSTLQQEAGRKLRFSSARTMAVAQRLYERGYITYMRTDSTNLSDEAINASRQRIKKLYGEQYVPDEPRQYRRKVKNAQEAHEAIRPAGDQMRVPQDLEKELDSDERKLYELIWKRTIASQMCDARGKRKSVKLTVDIENPIEISGQKFNKATFSSNGRTIVFPGFLLAYVQGSDDPESDLEDRESILPDLKENDNAKCVEVEPKDHQTQPPARFTEASLVKELESRGIGRPSTYAAVMQTIQDRGYVWKKSSALVPSWVAFATVKLLENHFSHLVDYEFTAKMEEDLDSIARGETDSIAWLKEFYFEPNEGLKTLVGDDRVNEIDARDINSIVIGKDNNGRDVVVRVGRYGAYLERMIGEDPERANIPDGITPDELNVDLAEEFFSRSQQDGRELGIYPENGQKIVVKDGRYGPYVTLVNEDEDSKEKPKTASLLKYMDIATVTYEDALQLLSLPRIVGKDENGNEITAQNGRYGPYISRMVEGKNDSRTLSDEKMLFTIDEKEALEIFAQPKRRGATTAKGPLADLGPHPDTGKNILVKDGRFGPYVTDGEINASLPRGQTPEHLTMDEAVDLLIRRAEKIALQGGEKKPAKKAVKKTTKKSTKKSTSKSKAKKD
ncbi:MAG: type I DNA topoisomerase [Acidimicrobiia bacterium]